LTVFPVLQTHNRIHNTNYWECHYKWEVLVIWNRQVVGVPLKRLPWLTFCSIYFQLRLARINSLSQIIKTECFPFSFARKGMFQLIYLFQLTHTSYIERGQISLCLYLCIKQKYYADNEHLVWGKKGTQF
jgi:hypothetical protein